MCKETTVPYHSDKEA